MRVFHAQINLPMNSAATIPDVITFQAANFLEYTTIKIQIKQVSKSFECRTLRSGRSPCRKSYNN